MKNKTNAIYKNDIPTVSEGFGFPQDKFFNGRTTVTVGGHGGLTSVSYYGRHIGGAAELFTAEKVSAFTQCFRCYAVIDGVPHHMRLSETGFYPFGYVSTVKIGEVQLCYEFCVINDGIIQRARVLKNPKGRKISLRMRFHDVWIRAARPGRTWKSMAWEENSKAFLASLSESAPKAGEGKSGAADLVTHIAIGSDSAACRPSTRMPDRNVLCILEAPVGRDGCSFFVLFGLERAAFKKRLACLRNSAAAECGKLFEDFRESLSSGPSLGHADPAVRSAAHTAVPCVELLSIPGERGAMRASQDYGIWGWDSMVYSDSFLMAGQGGVVAAMLDFYERTADPEKGILHAFNMQLQPIHFMAFGAQCLYVVMLYHHNAFSDDDETLRRHFKFALWIMERCAGEEVEGTGLTRGLSFFPDHPQVCGEDGDDIAAINNSIYYQGLRAMEQLAAKLGDTANSSVFRERAARCRKGFLKHFFDAKRGYFVDSVSASTLERRLCYPRWAILWITPFAYELVCDHVEKISQFMSREFPFSRGLRMVGPGDLAYGADGNQLAAYYPPLDAYYFSVMKFARASGELKRLPKLMRMFWDEHTYPEGFTECASDEWLALDNPGCKQAFTAKSWYVSSIHALAGIEFDSSGLTITTSFADRDLASLENVRFRGRNLSFFFEGSGVHIASISMNGRELNGTRLIGVTQLAARNKITVKRSSKPPKSLVITRALGATVEVLAASEDSLSCQVSAESAVQLCFQSPEKPRVRVDGKPAACFYSQKSGEGYAWIVPRGKSARVIIDKTSRGHKSDRKNPLGQS